MHLHTLSLRHLPFLRDAIFTLASGLHEILEVKNPGNNKVDGSHLHEVIKRNGFAGGITGNITFQRDNADRDFLHMDYIVFNFQNGAFVRVGIIGADTPEFKDCEQYKKAYGTALSRGCKKTIFRGVYAPVTVVRRSSHSLSCCIVVVLAFGQTARQTYPKFVYLGSSLFFL